jgi:hypothetical protein
MNVQRSSTAVDARLVVFDALTHAFWNNPQLPEAIDRAIA